MPNFGGAVSGAGTGASIGSAFGPWGTAIGGAAGFLGGLFGGDPRGDVPDWYEEEQRYWSQRQRDQEAQASRDYQGYVDPETGEYIPGTRARAWQGYEDILAEPGYTGEEAGGMFVTPEEAAAIRVSPEEEAGVMSLASAPVVGAMRRAEDTLARASAARGNYYPGLTAATERIQQEGGRQAAETNLRARLGIAEMRRAGDRDIIRNRLEANRDIAQTRLRGREFGTAGREGVAERDLQREMGYAGRSDIPEREVPWWRSAGAGAVEGALLGYEEGRDRDEGGGINYDDLIRSGDDVLAETRNRRNLWP